MMRALLLSASLLSFVCGCIELPDAPSDVPTQDMTATPADMEADTDADMQVDVADSAPACTPVTCPEGSLRINDIASGDSISLIATSTWALDVTVLDADGEPLDEPPASLSVTVSPGDVLDTDGATTITAAAPGNATVTLSGADLDATIDVEVLDTPRLATLYAIAGKEATITTRGDVSLPEQATMRVVNSTEPEVIGLSEDNSVIPNAAGMTTLGVEVTLGPGRYVEQVPAVVMPDKALTLWLTAREEEGLLGGSVMLEKKGDGTFGVAEWTSVVDGEDIAAHVRSGTKHDAPTWVTGDQGEPYVSFDGVDDLMGNGGRGGIPLDSTNGVTVLAVVRKTSMTSAPHIILGGCRGPEDGFANVQFGFKNMSGQDQIYFQSGDNETASIEVDSVEVHKGWSLVTLQIEEIPEEDKRLWVLLSTHDLGTGNVLSQGKVELSNSSGIGFSELGGRCTGPNDSHGAVDIQDLLIFDRLVTGPEYDAVKSSLTRAR